MFALKKFVASFLMPLSAALIALWAGWWLMRTERGARFGKALLLGGLLILTLASNKGIGIVLLRGLEREYPPQPAFTALSVSSSPLAKCRSIVVLGGGHADAANLSANNRLSSSALSRLVEGVRIARAFPHTELWVSGPRANDGSETHASVLKSAAMSLGIEETRIATIDDGVDTAGEAAAVRLRAGGHAVALVTSAWHMPRAVALFERAGVSVVPCPADYNARVNDDFRPSDYLGFDLSGLERTTKAVYERLGLTWARLTGQL